MPYALCPMPNYQLPITMKRVIVLVGLPASGKSQFARELLLSEPGKWVRSNKDLLREMAHASHWSPAHEKFILQLRDTIILMALESGKHVIVDDTNFGPHIEHIKQLVKGKAIVEVNDSFLQVPVEECIKRDLKRLNSVGKEVIMKMYNRSWGVPVGRRNITRICRMQLLLIWTVRWHFSTAEILLMLRCAIAIYPTRKF